jgi:hypothetical protein
MSGREPKPTRRSNALGVAMIAVPVVILAYALAGFAAIELLQWAGVLR